MFGKLMSHLASEKAEDVVVKGLSKMFTGNSGTTTTTTANFPKQPFNSDLSGNKKALFIGINYFGTANELKGCINDVRNIRQFVQTKFGFQDDKIRQLTDDLEPAQHPTKANILDSLRWLVEGAQPGDSLFLHYSGHGGTKKDEDGDEADGQDETICPVDVATAGQIIDDELHAILVLSLPKGVRLTAIFDSCHSGSVMDLPFSYTIDGNFQVTEIDNRVKAIRHGVRGVRALLAKDLRGIREEGVGLVKTLMSKDTSNKEAEEKARKEKRTDADVIQLSGCRDDQTSADANIKGAATGAMSYAFIQVMGKRLEAAAAPLTYTQLLGELRGVLKGKFSQVPQMSTGYPMDMKTQFSM